MENKLSETQHETLIGLMLGDGHLHKTKKIITQNASLIVERSSVDKDYLYDNYNEFSSFCNSPPISYSRIQIVNKVEGEYHYTKFGTRHLPIFSSYYDIWYPDGSKIVPLSLSLTPLAIAIWVADDAYIESKGSPYRLFLRFCSEGFSESENEFLASMLSSRYGEIFRLDYLGLNKKGYKKYRVVASDYASRLLLKEIDPFFPKSMIRKAYWRKPEARFLENEPERAYPNLKNRTQPTDNEKLIFNFIENNNNVNAADLQKFIANIGYSQSYSKKLITKMLTKKQIINVGIGNESKYVIYQ
jgi:hypothetical protein